LKQVRAGYRRIEVFEKYKERQKDKGFLGLTSREVTRLFFVGFLVVLCFVIISLMLPTVRTKPPAEEERGVVVRRAGEPGAQKAFELETERLLREARERGEIPSSLEPLEYPPPPTPFVEEPGIWSQVKDEAVNVLEEPVLYYALHQINSMTQEEIEKRVKEDGSLTEEEYGRDPAKYRGKFVRIEGNLRWLDTRPLSPNRSGVSRRWDGMIYNQQNKKFRNYYFYITRKDGDYITYDYCRAKDLSGNGDVVRLDGIFVKLYRTEVESTPGLTVTYPFIIGRELVKIKEPTYSELYSWGLPSVVAGIIGLVIVVIFFAVRRDIKADKEFKREMHGKLKKRVDNEFIRAHSKTHTEDKPGECGKGEPPQKPEPPSPETSAPPKA
jgi:hypothetical protein